MTTWQRAVKYLAIAFALFLSVSIIGGILGVAGLFGAVYDLFAVQDAVGEMTAYTVDETVDSLALDIQAAALYICVGDTLSVESNLSDLVVDTGADGCLRISEEKDNLFDFVKNEAVLYLYVPQNTTFDAVSLSTGAGIVTVESLCADTLSMSLGAGEVRIDRLIAQTSAAVSGGAGALTIEDCTLNRLNLDMGVGELDLTGQLTGDCEINMGIGEAELLLRGSSSSYSVQVDKGIGAVTVDGQSVDNSAVFGDGENRVEIDGGVGEITVKFAP